MDDAVRTIAGVARLGLDQEPLWEAAPAEAEDVATGPVEESETSGDWPMVPPLAPARPPRPRGRLRPQAGRGR